MEQTATTESDKCLRLAAELRVDATRATLHGLADRLIRGAEDLEQHACVLLAQSLVAPLNY